LCLCACGSFREVVRPGIAQAFSFLVRCRAALFFAAAIIISFVFLRPSSASGGREEEDEEGEREREREIEREESVHLVMSRHQQEHCPPSQSSWAQQTLHSSPTDLAGNPNPCLELSFFSPPLPSENFP